MFNRRFLVLYALIYCLSFHYVYIQYLSDVFEYAYYIYISPENSDLIYCYILAVTPILFRCNKPSVSIFAFDLIYSLLYVPGQMMCLFMWTSDWYEYYLISIYMFIGILIIASSGHFFSHSVTVNVLPGYSFKLVLFSLSIIGVLLVFSNYWSTMSLVGFDKVYELRKEANTTDKGPIVGYLMTWLIYVSLPYFLAISFSMKNKLYFLVAIAISLVLYSAQGAKIAILNSFIVFSFYILFTSKGDFLAKILVFSSIIFLMISVVLPDDGVWLWFKAILMVRVFGNSGWMLVTYHDYFTNHGFTYFSHIGLINYIFSSYPYGSYSLGQLIGLEYSGSSEANFNANFWASDGIAAIGTIGIPIISFIFSIYLVLLNYLTKKVNLLFVYLIFSGFLMSLLNLPLSAALLSGGGLILLFLFFVNHRSICRVK